MPAAVRAHVPIARVRIANAPADAPVKNASVLPAHADRIPAPAAADAPSPMRPNFAGRAV